MSEMVFPQIGFGGTSVKMLEDGYHTAYAAVLDARRAIAEIEFNGRDYPRPGSFDEARQQRNEMLEKLQGVEDYLVEHINAICEAGDNERERCARLAAELAKNPLNAMCGMEGAK